MEPIIFLNFKTYQNSTGENALKLAKIVDAMNCDKAIVCLQAADIYRVASHLPKLRIFAQHAEPLSYGSNTGHTILEALKQAGATGTMLSHSENRMDLDSVQAVIGIAGSLKMETLVCVKDMKEAEAVDKLKPTYIAYEDPLLIGTGKSVTEYTPYNVSAFCKSVKNSIPLVGAGISKGEDVRKALSLGANGVLLASAFVNSKTPGSLLASLMGKA